MLSLSPADLLTQLRIQLESAELATRIAGAHERAARARRSPSASSAKVEAFPGPAPPHPNGARTPPRSLPTPGWPSETTNGHARRIHGPPTAYAGYCSGSEAQQQRAEPEELAERQEARHEAQMAAMAAHHSAPVTISQATPKVRL